MIKELIIASLTLTACAPKPTEATLTPTQVPPIDLFISPEEGIFVFQTGDVELTAGDLGNFAVEDGKAKSALLCTTAAAQLAPEPNAKEPWATIIHENTRLPSPKECIDRYIEELPTQN